MQDNHSKEAQRNSTESSLPPWYGDTTIRAITAPTPDEVLSLQQWAADESYLLSVILLAELPGLLRSDSACQWYNRYLSFYNIGSEEIATLEAFADAEKLGAYLQQHPTPRTAEGTTCSIALYRQQPGVTLTYWLDDGLMPAQSFAELFEQARRAVTPQEQILQALQALPADKRLEELFSDLTMGMIAELPWNVWSPLTRKIKRLVPDANLNHLDMAKREAKRSTKRDQAPRAHTETVDHRPTIRITTDMAHVVDAGITAISDLSHAPHVWQRGGQLCMIGSPPHPPAGVKRAPGTPLVLTLPPARLTELASMSARWEKFVGDDWCDTFPPDWFAQTVLGRPSWPFPVLEGIIDAPTLRANGTILDTPGYDAESGLYLALNGPPFLHVPDRPTREQARQALTDLAEPFEDFPFQAEHHRSAALAAALSLVGRHAIDGPVPLSGVTAPRAGSGKGLLVDLIALIATGRTATRWAYTENEEEQRKRLLSFAMAGDRLVCIDNVAAPIGSAAMDMALTSRSISDRLLGVSKTVEAPWHAVMFATGNNLTYRGDTSRRVVPIVIDPQIEHPEQRTGFKKANILQWVIDHRPRLLAAALTALRAYIVAEQPQQEMTPYGSFEAWSALIRGCLLWCGWPDPNASREHIEAENDLGYEELSGLLAAWEAVIGTQEITLQRVIQRINTELKQLSFDWKSSRYGEAYEQPDPEYIAQWTTLRDALGRLDEKYDGERLNATRLGYALRKYANRIVAGRKLVRGEQRLKEGWPWRVVTVSTPQEKDVDDVDDVDGQKASTPYNPLKNNGAVDDVDDVDDFGPKPVDPYLPLTLGDDGDDARIHDNVDGVDRSLPNPANTGTFSEEMPAAIKVGRGFSPTGGEVSTSSTSEPEQPLKDLPLADVDNQKLSTSADVFPHRIHVVF